MNETKSNYPQQILEQPIYVQIGLGYVVISLIIVLAGICIEKTLYQTIVASNGALIIAWIAYNGATANVKYQQQKDELLLNSNRKIFAINYMSVFIRINRQINLYKVYDDFIMDNYDAGDNERRNLIDSNSKSVVIELIPLFKKSLDLFESIDSLFLEDALTFELCEIALQMQSNINTLEDEKYIPLRPSIMNILANLGENYENLLKNDYFKIAEIENALRVEKDLITEYKNKFN